MMAVLRGLLTAAVAAPVLASAPLAWAEPAAPAAASAGPSLAERLEGREQARISFVNSIRSFRVEREDGDDVVYLQDSRRGWLRGELACFGIEDPQFAWGLRVLDHGTGVDRFSRLRFVSPGHFGRADCRLTSLVRLTEDEAVEVGLVRARPPAEAPKPG